MIQTVRMFYGPLGGIRANEYPRMAVFGITNDPLNVIRIGYLFIEENVWYEFFKPTSLFIANTEYSGFSVVAGNIVLLSKKDLSLIKKL